jgi:hypothetical protein
MKCGVYIFKHLYLFILSYYIQNMSKIEIKNKIEYFKQQGIVLFSDLFGRRLKSSFPFTLFESLMSVCFV